MKQLEIKDIQKLLKESVGDRTYIHCLGVMDTAIKLASKYNYDTDKAALAGLIHDCGKLKDNEEILKAAQKTGIIQDDIMANNIELLHAPLGAFIAENTYGIKDEEILQAVRYHTTGRINMTLLDKIIYLSDYIEPNRVFLRVSEIREFAYKDIDKALLMAIEDTIMYVIENRLLLHNDTVNARNHLIINLGKNGR